MHGIEYCPLLIDKGGKMHAFALMRTGVLDRYQIAIYIDMLPEEYR